MRQAITLSCATPDYADHAASPRRLSHALLLALAMTVAAGCSLPETTASDPGPAREEVVTQELNCSAHCDNGWDFGGNPIPFNATAGGFTVCSLANATATCTPSGWTLGASGCNASSMPYNTKFGVNSAT